MSLRLQETCAVFPGSVWLDDGTQFVVTSGETVVGPIWLDGTASEPSWRWSISALEPRPDTNGRAPTREEALADLVAAWHRWLARTGLRDVDDGEAAA